MKPTNINQRMEDRRDKYISSTLRHRPSSIASKNMVAVSEANHHNSRLFMLASVLVSLVFALQCSCYH
jgi:hypothetical protein